MKNNQGVPEEGRPEKMDTERGQSLSGGVERGHTLGEMALQLAAHEVAGAMERPTFYALYEIGEPHEIGLKHTVVVGEPEHLGDYASERFKHSLGIPEPLIAGAGEQRDGVEHQLKHILGAGIEGGHILDDVADAGYAWFVIAPRAALVDLLEDFGGRFLDELVDVGVDEKLKVCLCLRTRRVEIEYELVLLLGRESRECLLQCEF